jgi:hypothetical protein
MSLFLEFIGCWRVYIHDRFAAGLRMLGWMRLSGRRNISWLAIIAVALHAILWGVAPMAAAPSTDPFFVICHSGAATPDQPAPANPSHSQACDHCTLCAAANAPATLDAVLAGQLAPARLLHVLRPVSAGVRGHLATTPNFARGPPAFA